MITMATKAQLNTEAMEKALEAGKGRFEQAAAAGSENAAKGMEQVIAFSRKQLDGAVKMMDDVSVASKANMEALVASQQAATKGAEALTRAATDYSKKSMEEASATIKSLTSAKSPKEFFEIQTKSTKASYDALVAEASKFSELALRVSSEMFQPLSTRLAVSMEKFTTAAK